MNTTKELKLLKFDNKRRNQLLQSTKDIIIDNKKQLIFYINEALENNNSNKILHLGIIPKETIIRIKKEIQNIKKEKIDKILDENVSYDLVIGQKEIRHIKKYNMLNIEVQNYICMLEQIIVNFDNVSYTLYNKNQHSLRFIKKLKKGIYIALEVISNRNKRLRTHTLFLDKIAYKKRNLSLTLDN